MTKNYLFIILSCFFGSCGLLDIEKATSQKVVGNIYIGNSNISEDSGLYLIFRTENVDQYLLEKTQYVDYLKGNDTSLVVKTNDSLLPFYYVIKHLNGKEILDINNIPSLEFIEYEKRIEIIYHFVSK